MIGLILIAALLAWSGVGMAIYRNNCAWLVLIAPLIITLAGCSSPAPAPPPVFSGAIPTSAAWSLTESSSKRALANGAFDFQQAASAASTYDSYVEVPLAVTLPITATFTINYTVTGDPTFVHDTPDNTADDPATVRLLLRSGVSRWVSNPVDLVPGTTQISVPLLGAWQAVDGPALSPNVTAVGFCFGGGYFACHGVAVASGSATLQINAVTIQ